MVALYDYHKRMTNVIHNKIRMITTKRGLTTQQRGSKSNTKHQSNSILQKEEELPPVSGDELQVIVSTKRTGIKNCSTSTTTSHVTIKEEVLQSSFCSQSTSATATTTMHDDDDTGSMNDDGNNCKEEEEEMSYIRILPPPQKDSVAKLIFQYYNNSSKNGDEDDTSSCNMMTKCYMVPIPTDIKDGDEFYVKAGTTRIQLICPQYHNNNQSRYNKNYYNTMVFELVPCTCKDCTAISSSTLLSDYGIGSSKHHQRQRAHHRYHRHRQQHYPNLCHLRVVNDIQFLKFYNDIEQHMNHNIETLCWTKGWNSFTNIHVKQIQNVLSNNNSSSNSNDNTKNECNHIKDICIANVPKQYQNIIIDYIRHLMKSHSSNSSTTSNNNHHHTNINITVQDTITDFQTIDTLTSLSNCIKKSLALSHMVNVQCDS